MKRAIVLAAAGVILAANGWLLISVSRNRSDARGGTVELTERELRLPARSGESTALFLELDWDTLSISPERRRAPQWLDAAKLAELGFDCSVAVTHPDARDHYRSMRTALVFLVLEYEGEAWKQASPDRKQKTRLFAVDAGRNPHRLREKYADATRYIITRGLVTLRFQERTIPEEERLPQPRLQGWIEAVLPDRIFVPLPHSKVLEDLRDRGGSSEDRFLVEEEPRFAVTVSWGRNHEPWVSGVRQLAVD
jgi:hypothetical protein